MLKHLMPLNCTLYGVCFYWNLGRSGSGWHPRKGARTTVGGAPRGSSNDSRVCSARRPGGSSAELRSKVDSSPSTQPQHAFLPPSFTLARPLGSPGDPHHLPTSPHVRPSPFSLGLPPPQKYVQDILQEQLAEPVYRALKEQGGHIYVCGDVTMAADVLKAIQRIMTQQGKLSVEDAGVFISRLRVSFLDPCPNIQYPVSSSSPHLSPWLGEP